jgi:hypothetical protein
MFAGRELPDDALVEEDLELDAYNTRAEVRDYRGLLVSCACACACVCKLLCC